MHQLNLAWKGCAALVVAGGIASAASAWDLSEQGDKSFLYAKDDSGASVTLACSEKLSVQATVYLDGNEMDDLSVLDRGRISTRQVTLDTESTEPRGDRWAYIRSAKALISIKPWQGRRIYNAAVTGSPVSIDIRRVGEYTLNLPPVDDNFKSFAKSCL